jgi:hypothetical protein
VCVLCASFSANLLFKTKTRLSRALINALFISMGLNLAGVVVWERGLDENSYIYLFILWYLWVVSILIRKGTINWLKHFNASLSRWESLQSRLACLLK